MGKVMKDKLRAIAANFEHFKHKALVKSCGKQLKGTKFGLNDQFPHEIINRRKILYSIMIEHILRNDRVILATDKMYKLLQLQNNSLVTLMIMDI